MNTLPKCAFVCLLILTLSCGDDNENGPEQHDSAKILFEAATSSASEDAERIYYIRLTVEGDLSEEVEVTFDVSGTASSDDFSISSAPVTLPEGTTFLNLELTVVKDFEYEVDEEYIDIELTGVSGDAVLGDVTVHRVTIARDDPIFVGIGGGATELGFVAGTSRNIEINLTDILQEDVLVTLGIEEDEAEAFSFQKDSYVSEESMMISAGETVASLNVHCLSGELNSSSLIISGVESPDSDFGSGVGIDSNTSSLQLNGLGEEMGVIEFELSWTSLDENLTMRLGMCKNTCYSYTSYFSEPLYLYDTISLDEIEEEISLNVLNYDLDQFKEADVLLTVSTRGATSWNSVLNAEQSYSFTITPNDWEGDVTSNGVITGKIKRFLISRKDFDYRPEF